MLFSSFPPKGDFKDRAEMIDFNIRIKNVTRHDAGEYRCEVSAPTEQGQNLQEDTVMLEVLGKAPVHAQCLSAVPSSSSSPGEALWLLFVCFSVA